MLRYFVDENLVAVGRALAEVRDDVTYVGDPGNSKRQRPPCPITLSTEDDQWLPIVGQEGWCVLTRDKRIRRRPAEIAAVRAHGVRLFAITSSKNLNRWELLGLLLRNWDWIEQESTTPGPFVASLTQGAPKFLAI